MPKRLFWNAIGTIVRNADKKRRAYRQALIEDYEFSIAQTRLVSSKGLLASTDIKPSNPKSGVIDALYLDALPARIAKSNTEYTPSVYICNSALAYFAGKVLDKIDRQIILVSGDSTLSVGWQTLGDAYSKILQSNLVGSWWVQNLVETTTNKVQRLPVGLDFHTPWTNPLLHSSEYILPSLQEAELRATLLNSSKFEERLPLAYCDWIKSASYGDRKEALEGIESSAMVVPSSRIPRSQTWGNATKYAFVASPSGVGTDCHRTWEAISLGCIPIVRRGHISEMFAGMPVVVVDDWREVNKENLNRWHQNMHDQEFDYSNLFLQIWKRRFRESSQDLKTALKIDDYIMSF